MNRHVHINEQELESAQLVSSNLSAPNPSFLHISSLHIKCVSKPVHVSRVFWFSGPRLREDLYSELLSDCGTHFRAGGAELQNAFQAMANDLKQQLARTQVNFQYNPPSAPHFSGIWEQEMKSIKMALHVALGNQPTTETVLHKILIEVEGILISKPLGYISSVFTDPDPVTSKMLLMGRPDSSLPQAIYCASELLGRTRWCHSQISADHFWTACFRYYLPNLQTRQKWETDEQKLVSGQVVRLDPPTLPPLCLQTPSH